MSDTELGLKVLATPMRPDNDAKAKTVREYLVALLRVLWKQGEGFSGKRPFGNSGWSGELARALADAKLMEGTYADSPDGLYLDTWDYKDVDRLVALGIEALL